MNKRRVETLIPIAIKKIEEMKELRAKDKNNNPIDDKIDKIYSSYLASFGPSVITSGALMAVMFYAGDDKKSKIIKLMEEVLKEAGLISGDLKDYVNEEFKKGNALKATQLITDANIACKLAIRTFDLYEENEKKED
jgi:CRISPR/Cas system CMR-associated protein Cmr5 small subunit